MDVFARRRAGVLLHPTSVPGSLGNGDLGPDAYRFVDMLVDCRISLWQTLPLGPTHDDLSPYQCLSVHAGDFRLISLQLLVEQGCKRGGIDARDRDKGPDPVDNQRADQEEDTLAQLCELTHVHSAWECRVCSHAAVLSPRPCRRLPQWQHGHPW